jgi:hypothetical protein
MEVTDSLFGEILSVVKAVYPDTDSEAAAILPVKEKYDALLGRLATVSFDLGKKMAQADVKDDAMYSGAV